MEHYRLHEHLTPELFENPTAEYRGTPFWAWNGKLTKEELLWQIDVLRQMGFGGFHMHSRTGMDVPYLSEEFMDLVRACTAKAKEANMLAWLYDEDRWPSGFAGGLVTKDPQYRARYLLVTPVSNENTASNGSTNIAGAQASRSNNGKLAGCYDVELDEHGYLTSYRKIEPDENVNGTKWYAYLETPCENPWYNNQTYVNTLDKKAIDRFIEVTYEAYKKAVGQDFETVIPSIFTDEPQFSHKTLLRYAHDRDNVILPWTDDFPDTFRQAYGEEVLDHLPLLIWEPKAQPTLPIRYHYHDHVAERFTEAFADNCGKWCRENHLMLTGHMMEEPTLRSQTAALGEAMRSYRSFGIPGIDMLCNNYEYTTAKQAQSAAHQYGCPGVLSELYGVTTWDFDFRGHKLQGDWQAALGVTVRVPHLSWMTMKGEAKRDYPASINYQAPWHEKYALVEDHFARINTALTRGKPVVSIAVVHPVESYWLHWGPEEQTGLVREAMDRRFQDLTKWLITGTLDFDFLCESNLPLQCKAGGNPLQVGDMSYQAVLVPQCETIRKTTLDRLLAFGREGGRLLILGTLPDKVDALPSTEPQKLLEYGQLISYDKAAIYQALEAERLVEIRDQSGRLTENLICQLRQDEESQWLFIAQGVKPEDKDLVVRQAVRITVQGLWDVEYYDTMTGEIAPIAVEHRGQTTALRNLLCQQDSMLLHLIPAVSKKETAQKRSLSVEVWKYAEIPATVPVQLEEPNVCVLDVAEYALDEEDYRPAEEILVADNILRSELDMPSRLDAVAQPWTLPAELPVHRMRLRFTVQSEVAVKDAQLALEDAEQAVILLDGMEVPACPVGWFTDKCIGTVALPEFSAGSHTIEVSIPFGKSAAAEWCYLLGSFDVRLAGSRKILTAPNRNIGFGTITCQGLPFYGGNLSYRLHLDCPGGNVKVYVPQYRGALIGVELDGKEVGQIAFAPYEAVIPDVSEGKHVLDLKLYGTRYNTFGQIHYADPNMHWMGPDSYRTTDDNWCMEYRLHEAGILTAPKVHYEVKHSLKIK